MNRILLVILFVLPLSIFSQEDNKPALQKEARALVREGNELYNKLQFADAEVAYRKAIEKDPTYEIANYNLGLALSQQKRDDEALAQYEVVGKTATDKMTKAETFHNIGNTHFGKKDYAKSVEAYKNSLRNNPKDDETRYNLALAQELLEDQQQNQDQNDDNKDDQNKDDQNKDKQENQDNKDKEQDENQDKKESDDGGDDKQKDEEEDKGKDENKQDENKDQQPPKPQEGKLSPQQIQQLLEAMNNEEKKTQEKMNAKKEKGPKIKQEKDW